MITPPREGSGVLRSVSLSVCVSVCLSVHQHISGTASTIFTKFFEQIPCGHGSVLLWGSVAIRYVLMVFMDDITFGHSGPYGDDDLLPLAIPGRNLMSMNALFLLFLMCDMSPVTFI